MRERARECVCGRVGAREREREKRVRACVVVMPELIFLPSRTFLIFLCQALRCKCFEIRSYDALATGPRVPGVKISS